MQRIILIFVQKWSWQQGKMLPTADEMQQVFPQHENCVALFCRIKVCVSFSKNGKHSSWKPMRGSLDLHSKLAASLNGLVSFKILKQFIEQLFQLCFGCNTKMLKTKWTNIARMRTHRWRIPTPPPGDRDMFQQFNLQFFQSKIYDAKKQVKPSPGPFWSTNSLPAGSTSIFKIWWTVQKKKSKTDTTPFCHLHRATSQHTNRHVYKRIHK